MSWIDFKLIIRFSRWLSGSPAGSLVLPLALRLRHWLSDPTQGRRTSLRRKDDCLVPAEKTAGKR